MKKIMSFGLLLVVMMSMMFFASCAKKAPDGGEYPGEEPMADRSGERSDSEAELEKQRRIAEEEIEAYRERQAAEAEQIRKEKEAAAFVDANVYFAFDNSSLSAEAREALLKQAKWLQENSGRSLIVEGHCDNRGTEEYNLALGSRRAQSVKDFLVNAGVDSSRIITISYGEERPAVRGDSEEAWSRNRRTEFRLR